MADTTKMWFKVGGKIFDIVVSVKYKYIAMDRNEYVYLYTERPVRNTCDDDTMWHSHGSMARVYVKSNVEQAMLKVGWRRSLRKLRCS